MSGRTTFRSMETVLLDEVIDTDYGQFDFLWTEEATGFEGDWDQVFSGQVNGLVGAADPGGVYLNLARRSGGSRVRVVLLDAPPELPPPYFEDVVEVSSTLPPGSRPRWMSWGCYMQGTLDALPPGSYRLRVSAHGRDAGRAGEVAEGVVDEYLVEMWPADAAEDEIVRVGSEDARHWHSEIGGAR